VTKIRGIRWSLASRIVWAWIFTIPLAGLVGAGMLLLARSLHAW
jgi:phosphate/sulfate permease